MKCWQWALYFTCVQRGAASICLHGLASLVPMPPQVLLQQGGCKCQLHDCQHHHSCCRWHLREAAFRNRPESCSAAGNLHYWAASTRTAGVVPTLLRRCKLF